MYAIRSYYVTKSGGGYFYDEVLEYRVWVHPERGGPDHHEGEDYFHAFHNAGFPPSDDPEAAYTILDEVKPAWLRARAVV